RRGDRGADAKISRSRDRGLTWEDASSGLPSPQRGMLFSMVADPDLEGELLLGTMERSMRQLARGTGGG
ncbi:MAG: hypothetical protein C4294_08770, partial [Nitrospiraceae bacterium]